MKRTPIALETARMLLRDWRDSDEAPFIAMNSDPKVMEFFSAVPTPTQSRDQIMRMRAHFAEHGYGLNVMEAKATGEFLGIAGVFIPSYQAHYTPCLEIGWRLPQAAWNLGYATEAARRSAQFGFEELRVTEIIAVTAPLNQRSRRVMEKLGMTHDPLENFPHPRVPAGHPLQEHVLYRLPKNRFYSPTAAKY